MSEFKSPFPYFGGKSSIADMVWSRFGDTPNYVEPFFGSGAMLLSRPNWSPDKGLIETGNDASGFVANFWRAVRNVPDEVAYHADWPSNENDLHARHAWLVGQSDQLVSRLEGDPDFYDTRIAGWWVWGMSCWIGGGFCSGNGPWQRVQDDDGSWQLVHLGDAGQGVNRKLVHLGDAGQGVNRKLVHLGDANGNAGTGEQGLYAWMEALSERLARVRVCCGDWSRVCGPTPTFKNGLTAVFLDPPYTADAGRMSNLYEKDCLQVGHAVAAWCKENQDNPLLRIALCGYEGEYDLPSWECVAWKANGGYGNQSAGTGRDNANKERVWFSPHCLRPDSKRQMSLF